MPCGPVSCPIASPPASPLPCGRKCGRIRVCLVDDRPIAAPQVVWAIRVCRVGAPPADLSPLHCRVGDKGVSP